MHVLRARLERILWVGLAALIGVVVLAGAGCGGGGGGAVVTPPSGNLFSGNYDLLHIWGMRFPLPSRVAGGWGTALADGAETMDLDSAENEVGTINDPALTGSLRYGVGLERTLVWRSFGGPLVDVYAGGIRADGSVAATASLIFGQPGIFLLNRREGVWSNASLNGDYHVCGFTFDPVFLVHAGWVGTLTFGGTGTGSLAAGINLNGTTNPFGPAAVSYSVTPAGVVDLDLGNDITLQGSLGGGGDLVFASGSTTANGPPALFVLLRASGTTSTATLNGAYHTVGFAKDTVTNDHRCVSGAVVSDGAGTIRWTFRDLVETVSGTRGDTGSYSVVGNGSLLVNAISGDNLRGGVSPSGDFALLGRITDPNSDPTLWFLFR